MGCADPPSKGFGADVNHRGFFVWLFPWTTMLAMDRLDSPANMLKLWFKEMYLLIEPGFCSDVAFIANLVDDDDFNCNCRLNWKFEWKLWRQGLHRLVTTPCPPSWTSSNQQRKQVQVAGAVRSGLHLTLQHLQPKKRSAHRECCSFLSAVSFRNGEKWII